MSQLNKCILGMSFDSKPIFAPKHNHTHTLLLSAAGAGKTINGTLPSLQSLIADTERTNECLSDDLSFATDAIYSALLDPSSDELRNQYSRQEPRTLLELQLSDLTEVDK